MRMVFPYTMKVAFLHMEPTDGFFSRDRDGCYPHRDLSPVKCPKSIPGMMTTAACALSLLMIIPAVIPLPWCSAPSWARQPALSSPITWPSRAPLPSTSIPTMRGRNSSMICMHLLSVSPMIIPAPRQAKMQQGAENTHRWPHLRPLPRAADGCVKGHAGRRPPACDHPTNKRPYIFAALALAALARALMHPLRRSSPRPQTLPRSPVAANRHTRLRSIAPPNPPLITVLLWSTMLHVASATAPSEPPVALRARLDALVATFGLAAVATAAA